MECQGGVSSSRACACIYICPETIGPWAQADPPQAENFPALAAASPSPVRHVEDGAEGTAAQTPPGLFGRLFESLLRSACLRRGEGPEKRKRRLSTRRTIIRQVTS